MSIDYKQSGVDIEAGNESVRRIRDKVAATFDEHVITELGTFGALYDMDILREYKHPVLIQSIDGVGTKLNVAKRVGRYDTVGEDIVNHCCNDIVCQGARPLTFLDYIAADKLKPETVEEIVSGMAKACRESGVNLIGGEMAEMPGVYGEGEHDIVGCMTGVVEKDKIITDETIGAGDRVIGLGATGLHTNGFSLVRKIFFEMHGFAVSDPIPDLEVPLGDELLKPHRNYSHVILPLLEAYSIKGITHITGGGMIENIPRMLPDGLAVEIRKGSWPVLPIFDLIQTLGEVDESEMYRVFNMGIGMVLIVDPEDEEAIKSMLTRKGEKVYTIGKVIHGKKQLLFKYHV
ncbi:MAG: phosphoribosylformylglycinamidine cyclo-ligase [Candidatus Bipolaricaulia bacterium]